MEMLRRACRIKCILAADDPVSMSLALRFFLPRDRSVSFARSDDSTCESTDSIGMSATEESQQLTTDVIGCFLLAVPLPLAACSSPRAFMRAGGLGWEELWEAAGLVIAVQWVSLVQWGHAIMELFTLVWFSVCMHLFVRRCVGRRLESGAWSVGSGSRCSWRPLRWGLGFGRLARRLRRPPVFVVGPIGGRRCLGMCFSWM